MFPHMTSKMRLFFWLPVLLAIMACATFVPPLKSKPSSTSAIKNFSGGSTSSRPITRTLIPSVTFTPTISRPSPTPSPASTSTPTPTLITLETQLSIYENLWSIVNDTYVYPDFNGVDWNAIHEEYRQLIFAGMTNSQFYLAMSELITRLGDDHSQFLNPQEVAKQEAEYQGTYDYVGIGILVSAVPERQRVVILSVFAGSPAEEAGLQPRDSIISVDGNAILDEDGYQRDIVRGPEGTGIDLISANAGRRTKENSCDSSSDNWRGSYPL